MAHALLKQKRENDNLQLRLIFVAELFSKLSKENQDYIISQIKDLLLHEQ